MSDELLESISVQLMEMSKRMGSLEARMESVPHDEHNEHHDYIKEAIEKTKEEKEFYRQLRIKLATTGLIGALGVLCTVVWYAATKFISQT